MRYQEKGEEKSESWDAADVTLLTVMMLLLPNKAAERQLASCCH